MVAEALLSSVRDDWRTPGHVLLHVQAFAGRQIALDPCSAPGSLVGAAVEYRLERGEDGLTLPWDVDAPGLVYVNPPYGKSTREWLARADACAKEALVLLPARTDTRWWQDEAPKAAAICFWRGRITFVGGQHPAPFPSALLYYGRRFGRFRDVFTPCGMVVRP